MKKAIVLPRLAMRMALYSYAELYAMHTPTTKRPRAEFPRSLFPTKFGKHRRAAN
jgi:hypothetical protein